MTVSPDNAGTVSVNSVPVTAYPYYKSYETAANVLLSAIPREGWMFTRWKGSILSDENPLNVDVNCVISIAAEFTPDPEFSGYQAYISHISGGYQEWRDFLQVDNTGGNSARVMITLYGEDGSEVYSKVHNIAPSDKSLINLKNLSSKAMTGVVAYSNPDLLIRQSQENTNGGGITEFILPDTLGATLGFFYSNFTDSLAYNGLAIANFGSTATTVTLTAMGNGGALASLNIQLGARQKTIGTHDTWFPGIASGDLRWIKATGTSPYLAGVAITGDASGGLMVFTQALQVSTGLKSSNYQAYISHITNGYAEWRDFLQVDNTGSAATQIQVILYGENGSQVYSGVHNTPAGTRSLIDLKALSTDVMTGMVTFSSQDLLIRQSQENTYGGGITEFILPQSLGSTLGFFYSDFTDSLTFDGLALTNFNQSAVTVTLTAMGSGGALDSVQILLGPNQKTIGNHDAWFPGIDSGDLQWIRAESTGANLAGVALTGNWSGSLMVFTRGQVLE
ncbi:MAG: hypothetical protein V1793_01340 [Pseudomonadota bacterium]